jgi:hypothetical protein
VRVEVLASGRRALEAAAAVLPVGAHPQELAEVDTSYVLSKQRSGDSYVLDVDGERIAGPAPLGDVLEEFEPHLTVRIAERAPHHVFIHAGVVSWRGRAIVFPGYSYAGKTTLVAELVRAGALYYSDEYAVLDRKGRVHPYPRPLQMRAPGQRVQTPLPLDELGGTAGSEPLPVELVAFCRYKPGGRWRPRKLSPGRAALEMFEYTMCAQHAPEAALGTLQQVVARASLLKGTRGETSQVIEFIAKTFDG